jgi:DNA-binding MarR family transcriptional regulator/GNAT superfamily N-acetyltransferase
VAAVRRFNRFYTQRIGVLREGLLESPFSLTEARVLFELAHRGAARATDLGRDLGLDAGYLSRILRGFEKKGLLERRPSPKDRRESVLGLTAAGRRTFASLDARSREEMGGLLRPLDDEAARKVVDAMGTIERALGAPGPEAPLLLRPHQPGDVGWVIHRHGILYAREYGWDASFEALVAGIATRFLERFDPRFERCFIAELDGAIVGSVFVVRKSKTVAQLRMLLVEPRARGRGLGHRLVAECLRFAEQAGYRKMVLWTNDVLRAARHVYEAAGFRLVREGPHRAFGQDLVEQTWEKDLRRTT